MDVDKESLSLQSAKMTEPMPQTSVYKQLHLMSFVQQETCGICTHLDFIHELHGLHNTDGLALGNLVTNLHKSWLARCRRSVESPGHGRTDLQHYSHAFLSGNLSHGHLQYSGCVLEWVLQKGE